MRFAVGKGILTYVVAALLVPALPRAAVPGPPENFRAAKKLAWEIHRGMERTLYCGCRYVHRKGSGGRIRSGSCGFRFRKNRKRAGRVEWEHMMPARIFGGSLSCWKTGGRGKCRRVSRRFREMEADLNNLAPAIGEVNADRSWYPYGHVDGEPRRYGRCDFEIDRRRHVAEPREAVRGRVARAWLYMVNRYGVRIERGTLDLMREWDRRHPVTPEECRVASRIVRAGGTPNRFVLSRCR